MAKTEKVNSHHWEELGELDTIGYWWELRVEAFWKPNYSGEVKQEGCGVRLPGCKCHSPLPSSGKVTQHLLNSLFLICKMGIIIFLVLQS